jgi:hypothetical protein
VPTVQDTKPCSKLSARCSTTKDKRSGPLIFFSLGFVVVKALGNVGSGSWILSVCDKCRPAFDFGLPSPENHQA